MKALNFFENRKDIHEFFSYKLRVNPAINIKELLTEKDFVNVYHKNGYNKNVNNQILSYKSRTYTFTLLNSIFTKRKAKLLRKTHNLFFCLGWKCYWWYS